MAPKAKVEKMLVQFYISKRVWEEFELLIWDPVRRRTIYGAKSKIIEMLLRNYTKERTSGTEQSEPTGDDFLASFTSGSSDDGRGDNADPGGNSSDGQRDAGSNHHENPPEEDGRGRFD